MIFSSRRKRKKDEPNEHLNSDIKNIKVNTEAVCNDAIINGDNLVIDNLVRVRQVSLLGRRYRDTCREVQEASFLNPLRCWIYGDLAALDKQRTSALGFKGSSILGLKQSSTGCRVLCYNFDGDKSLSKSDSSTQKGRNKLVLRWAKLKLR